ncbi:MAG: DNA helicase RecQ [Fibrobacterales bacterium]
MTDALPLLKKHFGYDSFRPFQSDIIQSILNKKDTLVIMPTGGGKSLCFQLPAIMMPGTCIVVSPLIALMKDQVEGLHENGIAASFLNSSQSSDEQREVWNSLREGTLDLLYISPEKLVTAHFLDALSEAHINMIAIDEAHCISMWGHDFRPEYTRMATLKGRFPSIPFVALTATADRITQNDICQQLTLESPERFLASFDRPNIRLTVLPGKKRFEAILGFIRKKSGDSGIIYCLSRKSTEKIAEKLQAKGINAGFYHAGMDAADRAHIQEEFIADRLQIICATIAFGMGIDKSNVRWVIHFNLPKNIEGYYQEIGRAGRDGLPSEALLFYSIADVMLLKGFIEDSGQRDVLHNKLQRMQDYADSSTCRRKILLSYFNEHLHENCANCDVCKNPPKTFDGTIHTQKALSAIIRIKEPVSTNILVDVLRGSQRREIIERGFHTIKTYGAGSDVSFDNWRHYLLQMIHQGYIEPTYGSNPALRVTEPGTEVLLKGKAVSLVEPAEQQKFNESKEAPSAAFDDGVFDPLYFAMLKGLRKEIADSKSIPAYLVFSDATLRQMSSLQPITDEQFLAINGVGEKKLMEYGDAFINAILDLQTSAKV